MQLTVLLPQEIFLRQEGVRRIVLETPQGSLGLLPRRLDCVCPLVAGLLVYETEAAREHYLALDRGLLVKRGAAVLVAVRRAVRCDDLTSLRATVAGQFRRQDEQEKNIRLALTRLESELVRRLLELKAHG